MNISGLVRLMVSQRRDMLGSPNQGAQKPVWTDSAMQSHSQVALKLG